MALVIIMMVIAGSADAIPDGDTPVIDRCSPVTVMASAARDVWTEAAAPDSSNAVVVAPVNPATRAKCLTQIHVMTVEVLQLALRAVPAQDAPTRACR